jgi:hypothetical protein
MSDDFNRMVAGALPGRPTLLECLSAATQFYNEQNDPRAATRSSLIKLAVTSIELHKKALANGIEFEDGKSPIAVAVTALRTVAKNEGVLK